MEDALFDEIGQGLTGKKRSSMFGVPCFKIGRKPFISFYQQAIVCKLRGAANEEAISLSGATYFKPMADGKAMTNWVQIPYVHAERWPYFATLAYEEVAAE